MPLETSAAEYAADKPVIYLTFDDGPSSDKVTEHILDVLADHNATATFFVTGLRAQASPEKIQLIIDAGHVLGNHALSHSPLTSLTDQRIVEEFSITNKYVSDAGGSSMHCFRAPFGDTDPRVNGIAREMGMRPIGWNIDTRDWDPLTHQNDITVQLEDSYDNSIVLMHDGPMSRWRTLAVFSKWMEEVGDLYEFRAIPSCLKPHGPTPHVPTPHADGQQPPAEVYTAVETEPQVTLAEVKITRTEKKTIPQLLDKLRTYELDLEPEVVAQTDNQITTY